MDIAPIPENAKAVHPAYQLVDMGPPRGVSGDDCGTAQMLLGNRPPLPGFPGRDQLAYFKPSPADLAILNAGGLLVMNQIGSVVQPFSLAAWPADRPEPPGPFVEIGGQCMTQAQYDAARAPLLAGPGQPTTED